jgi:chemotaxis protein MotB
MDDHDIEVRIHDDRDSDTPSVEVDSNSWLISYADMMTLIACFFILVVAFSNQEDPSFRQKADLFAKYFKGSVITAKEKQEKRSEGENKKLIESNDEIYKDDEEKSQKENNPSAFSNFNKIASISEIVKPKNLEITFSGSVMFKEGSTEISSEVEQSIEVFIDVLKMRTTPFYILFEGHTDDTDVKTNVFPSNWELSAARAAKILKKFEKSGFNKNLMAVVGYGESRPEYKNRNKEGRSIPKNQKLNRRVEIKVISIDKNTQDSLGLGIFFRDAKDKVKSSKIE